MDFKEVQVIAGKGGNGCLSFLQLPQTEWAGPDGGDGGNGGHVVFEGLFFSLFFSDKLKKIFFLSFFIIQFE